MTSDSLGTPRVITDASGAVKDRHDYLPFGEEIDYNLGGRSDTQKYVYGTGNPDNVRQKFTQKERDSETGLDYFGARYYSASQGRFTSPDEFKGGPEELFGEVDPHDPLFYADIAEPQSLNKYQYCLNNPLRYIDPDGHQTTTADAIRQASATAAVISHFPASRQTIRRTVNGAASALSEDNGLGPMDAEQNQVGRVIGHALALGQSGAEMIGGSSMVVGGQGIALASGGTLAIPAEAVAGAGAVIATHGALVGANTITNIFSSDNSSLGRSSTTKTSGTSEQKTTTTVTDPAGSTTYKTTPGKTGGQSTMIIRKDAKGNVKYVKQEARHRSKDFNTRPDHVHYKKPKDKELY